MTIRFGIAAVLAAGLSAGLAACQPGRAPGPSDALARNVLACRDVRTVAALHDAGAAFQRTADDHMASGSCRMFPAGHLVAARRVEGGLTRFVDPGNGVTYWAYPS